MQHASGQMYNTLNTVHLNCLRYILNKLFKIWKTLRINSDLNRFADFFFICNFWNRSSRVVFVFHEYPYQTITVYEIFLFSSNEV